VTGFWRPQLQACPTRHDNAEAGSALPAILVGLVGRVGSVGSQRLALPLAWVRADPADPRSSTHERLLVRVAVAQCAADDALVLDASFGISLLQEEGATRFVMRCAKNSTFRRATPPAYCGRGRIPTRGVLVCPLARTFKGTLLAATPPNRTQTWQDAGVTLRAEIWDDVVLCDAAPGSPSFTVIAVHDPRYREPLLLASPLTVTAQTLAALYHDRSRRRTAALGRQTNAGAPPARSSMRRKPASGCPALPTGFWDRRPQPTPGRLRWVLARCPFPHDVPLPARRRIKAAVTAHLPTGFWGQRFRAAPAPEGTPVPELPETRELRGRQQDALFC